MIRAEELLREAIKARPGEPGLVFVVTSILGKEGKLAEAKKLLEDGTKGCGNETCRKEYADDMARQNLIERMMERLETHSGTL